MKTILVTSELTFVPENYDRFILEMAKNPHVVGLMVLRNRQLPFLAKGIYLCLSGLAPGLGKQLVKNFFSSSNFNRKKTYQGMGKKIWFIKNINGDEATKILEDEQVDLVINSRTRYIYKESILKIPRWGCVNIHHGLLPDQRGLMCDFWAHLEDQDFGFSFHRMTKKIDDGDILKVVKVETPRTDYIQSILQASIQEVQACNEVIDQIASSNNQIKIFKNVTTNKLYRRNPEKKDLKALAKKGIKI